MASRLLIAAASLLLILVFTSCSKTESAEARKTDSPEPPVVAVERVITRDLSRNLALTAEFIPYQEIDVMSKVAGFVKQIRVDIGDRVRTGQNLATLEVPEMSDDLVKAAATVQRSQAEITRAEDDLTRAKAAQDIAHLSFKRLDDVAAAKPGLVAQQEIDDARSKDLMAAAQVSAAQSNVAAAQQAKQVDQAEQSRYKTMYQYSNVTAPFDGVITRRYANTGAMIQAGTASQTQAMPLVRLSQNNILRLMLPIPESAVPRIHLGQSVQVRVSSLNRTFTGTVTRFTDKIATATRTMETEVDVPNPSLTLIPGMYAEVDLELEKRSHVLAIPVTAVDLNSAAPTVYKVNPDGFLSITPVKLGLETATGVEVINGLSEADFVVVGNRSALKAGDKVKPKVVDISGSEASY